LLRVAGIDPGTGSFDICILEDGRFLEGKSIPTRLVYENPKLIVDFLKEFSPLNLIAGPSGHGLPPKPLEKASVKELSLAALVRPEDAEQTLGLRKVFEALKASRLPVFFLPSVKHLPTVPLHRKLNRIDLGTADKLCVAALAIHEQAERLKMPPAEASFLLIEVGYAFTALLRVEGGEVVAGFGGTSGPIGLLSSGRMDGEVAYLLGRVKKKTLASGGLLHASGLREGQIDFFLEGVARGEAMFKAVWEAFLEEILGFTAWLEASTGKPREILVSGRLSKFPQIFEELAGRLSQISPVRRLKGFTSKVKEAAQGAALLADGLAGGKHSPLVDALKIKQASGTVLDHVYLDGFEEVRKRMLD